jgi:hypothetical protein
MSTHAPIASALQHTLRILRGNRRSSPQRGAADAVDMQRPSFLPRRSGALMITAVAATDLIYRLLFRESVRRALGMRD